MAQLFPRWTNSAPKIVLAAALVAVLVMIGALGYYGSPEFTEVGYCPAQPIPYSHSLHAGDLVMDCRYCHWAVEFSDHANVPSTQTCMNCHQLILTSSERLMRLKESWSTDMPLRWVRVHKLPDYTYFEHAAHLAAGVGCSSCHGNVAQMIEVMQVEPLSMGWCLECHRAPDDHLRPRDQVILMEWSPGPAHDEFLSLWKRENTINPPVDCSGCHR